MTEHDDKFWGRASAALVRIALSRTRDPAKAEDLAQQAIVEALPGHPGEDLASFVSRASGLMRRNWFNERRTVERRQQESWMRTAAQRMSPSRRTPEDVVATRERKARLLGQLMERLKDDELAGDIVQEVLLGRDAPAEQAESLKRGIDEIRNAHKRLARTVRAIAAAEGGSDVAPGWDVEARHGDDEEALLPEAES